MRLLRRLDRASFDRRSIQAISLIVAVAAGLAAVASDGSVVRWLGTETALSVAVVGLGTWLLTRMILGRRALARRLELSEALADEQRRRVEVLADYELIAENSTDVIVRQAADLTYRYVSPAVRTLLGYEPDELVGMKPWKAIHREDVESVEKALGRLEAGADVVDVEHRVRHADGRWVWLHTVWRAIRDERGELAEIQTSSRDVSEQVRQRQALLSTQAEIERRSQEKARFLSTVSHEIRTPLTAVAGMAVLLAETELDPDQGEYVETIRAAAGSVVSIVSDLLDLSKAESGRLEINAVPFELEDTVSEVLRVLRPQAEAKGLVLQSSVEGRVGRLVGDPHRIKQVLVNLVGNAIKFTTTGSVSVEVEAQEQEGTIAPVRVGVVDTGVGVPPDRMEAIFDDFVQGDASTAAEHGGTGLGLGISRHLVHLMGGVMGVDSVEGEGSTFWFELALPRDDGAYGGAGRRCTVSGRRLDRSETAAMLRSEGWSVVEADDPTGAGESSGPAVWVGAVDRVDRPARLDGTIVVDTTPRRGNAERARTARAAGYVGAPATAEELDAVLRRVEEGAEFVTRHDVNAPPTSLRVLAADDAPSNRLLVERTLSRRGHRVVSVSGGRDALGAFESGSFDVVLLDGQMPDLTGIEVTRRIRALDAQTGRHTPIVALTGRVSEEERAEAIAAGADQWVAKPFDVSRLNEVVEKAGAGAGPVSVPRRAPQALDGSVFSSQVAGSPELAAELVDAVRQEWSELRPDLTPEAIENDLETVGHAAHRLRGALGMVGATEASDIASHLEQAADRGDHAAALSLLDDLTQAVARADSALSDAIPV